MSGKAETGATSASSSSGLVIKPITMPTDMDKKSEAERKGEINRLKAALEKDTYEMLKMKVELNIDISNFNKNMINHYQMTQIHAPTEATFNFYKNMVGEVLRPVEEMGRAYLARQQLARFVAADPEQLAEDPQGGGDQGEIRLVNPIQQAGVDDDE